jgi:hypothetical protein
MKVLKSPRLGVSQLCKTITSCADLWLRRGLNRSCSPCQELFNGMSHATWTQGNWVDLWLSVVGSQTANLTPDLCFGHNLCCKCPNGSCEPISDIYASIAFQWYKERLKTRGLTFAISFWSFGSPLGLQLPKWEFIWECECSFSHSPTLPSSCFGSHFCEPLPWSRAQG